MSLNTTFLRDYIPNPNDLQKLADWEFLGLVWTGEALGWSECIVSDDDQKYRSLSLDLEELEDATIVNILDALKLPLKKGMSLDEIVAVYGQADKTSSFIDTQINMDYVIHQPETLFISLTVSFEVGLKYMVVSNFIPKWMRA